MKCIVGKQQSNSQTPHLQHNQQNPKMLFSSNHQTIHIPKSLQQLIKKCKHISKNTKAKQQKNHKRNSTVYNKTTQSIKHFQIPHIHAMHPQHPTQPKHKISNSQNTLAIQHTKNSNHSSTNNRRPRCTGFTNPN